MANRAVCLNLDKMKEFLFMMVFETLRQLRIVLLLLFVCLFVFLFVCFCFFFFFFFFLLVFKTDLLKRDCWEYFFFVFFFVFWCVFFS